MIRHVGLDIVTCE